MDISGNKAEEVIMASSWAIKKKIQTGTAPFTVQPS